ncbi:cathepsin S-like [Tropilaelaps mercedesae]|uniref:Cathepsin S-like n=1 Tax=Tropilaelaps mercedesae TaxID=418985 RepID=A0A1V9XUE3_9ACAR|nr:cathepsin S-like [Tropilaelaps mercedesae]
MKACVMIVALVAITGVHAIPAIELAAPALVHAVLRAKWSSYKAEHGKEYAAHVEDTKMAIFLENTRAIEEHNTRFYKGLETFVMGHNELSDLTLEEIQSTRMGARLPSHIEEHTANASVHVASSGYSLPKKLDWRIWNGVGHVKNQGSCGSCYAFSAAGALETAHWRKHYSLPNISEQQIVDCTGEYGNNGCGGGWMHAAFKWLQNNGGYVAQDQYPYTGRVGTCQYAQKPKIGQIARYVVIKKGDEESLLDALVTTGTISIAYNMGSRQHAYYRGGILDVPNCGSSPTHAVLLIGYGSENGVDFWILKNSWGSKWGEKGYFRIRRGINMCGIADWASYPFSA